MKTFILSVLLIISGALFAQNYNIGHRQITWTDATRNNRPVKFEVYYPASTTADNVPVINNDKKFPLIVFGHGYQLTFSDYVWLKDSIVPKGFFLAFPRTEEKLFPDHTDFAKDFAFIINEFDKDKNDNTEWFYNRLNSRYAVSGHSMGGGCSMLSVQYSNKINAVYNFAAAETNPSAIAACTAIRIPALIFAGGEDCISPPSTNQQPMYNNIQPVCKTYVEITNAQHCHWANNSGICTAGQLFCAGIASSAKPTLATSFSLLLPWLNAALNNNRSEALRFQSLLQFKTGITFLQTCNLNNYTATAASENKVENIKIFPSLVSTGSFVTIQFPLKNVRGKLQLSDQNGKIVLKQNILLYENNGMKLSAANLQKGIYFILITAKEKLYKANFIVE